MLSPEMRPAYFLVLRPSSSSSPVGLTTGSLSVISTFAYQPAPTKVNTIPILMSVKKLV